MSTIMNEEKNYATKIWDPGENINLCFNFIIYLKKKVYI